MRNAAAAISVGLALLAVGCSDTVRIENDLPHDVRLSGCRRELEEVKAGVEIGFRPHSPCWVRNLTTLEALGCLRFPPEAFEDDSDVVVRVSSLDPDLTEGECVGLEDYLSGGFLR